MNQKLLEGIKQKVFGSLSRFLKLDTLIGRLDLEAIVPFYHAVSDHPLPHIANLYQHLPVSEFIKHIDALSRNFNFMSYDEYASRSSTASIDGKKPALLTFDDGLIECHSVIAPILKEKGIPAIFFINPSFVDQSDIFYRYKVSLIIEELQNAEKFELVRKTLKEMNLLNLSGLHSVTSVLLKLNFGDIDLINKLLRLLDVKYRNKDIYMSSNMIKDLSDSGHSIGGHSMDHPNFSDLDLSLQLSQIEQSVQFCQDQFGEKNRLFAFPFYDYQMPAGLYHKMFNDLNIDCSFGTSGLKQDIFRKSIQRLDMEGMEGDIENALKMELLQYQFKSILGKHRMVRN